MGLKRLSSGGTSRSLLLPLKHLEDDQQNDGYHQISLQSAVFSLSTSMVGMGIVGLPAIMVTVGLIPGIFLILLVSFLTNYSINILLRYSYECKAISYTGIMVHAFGRVGLVFLKTCIIINNFGLLVLCLNIIADTLSGSEASSVHYSGVLEEWADGQTWWNQRTAVMFLTTLFILAPLVFVWHTDHLEISSTTSMGTVILFVINVTTIFFYKLISGTISMPKLFPTVHPDTSTVLSLFTVMPILVTTYTCHHMIHPILSQLGNESDSKRVITISIRFCAATYVITSAFAYILFGDDTLNDVMGNFNAELEVPYGTLFKDVIRLGFALHLILVFPLLKFSLHMNLDSLFDQSASPTTVDNSHFFLVTCSLLTAAFLGALSVPDVWTIFQCIGSTSAVCLCFVFPGSLVLRDQDGIYTVREKLMACFLIFFASSVSVMAVFGDIYNLFT